MKRVNILLDETTILNIPFFLKLIKRYYVVSILAPVISILIASFMYIGQKEIYTSQINFRLMTEESNSASGAIASLLGEKTTVITPEEVVAASRSIDFIQELSEIIVNREDFSKLNFDNYLSKNKITHAQMFGACFDNIKCKVLALRARLSALYMVSADTTVDNRFIVTVRSAHPYTTTILLNELKNLMQLKRVNEIKRKLVEQYKLTLSLINEKKTSATLIDSSAQRNLTERARIHLEEVVGRLRSITSIFETNKLKLSQAEMRLKKIEEAYSNSDDKLASNSSTSRYLELKTHIKNLKNDIAELEVSMRNPSVQDLSILKKLREELKSKRVTLRRMKKIKRGRNIASVSFDGEVKTMSPEQARFEYEILKGQVVKLKIDHEALVNEKESASDSLLSQVQKLEELRPSNEYLKLLEQKLLQLKLLESTIVSDYVFDKFQTPIFTYKKTSLSKVIFFGAFLSFFFLMLCITISYMFDGRIYDKYELEKKFSDLEIIGNTPDFF